MRRDVNFGIGDAEIQVKEERKTDKSDIILIFRYLCCRNSTSVRSFFSLVFRLVSLFIVYFYFLKIINASQGD